MKIPFIKIRATLINIDGNDVHLHCSAKRKIKIQTNTLLAEAYDEELPLRT